MGETFESQTGQTVTVHDVYVRKHIRSTSVGSPTHIDVACVDGYQFAVVDVEATDSDGNSVLEDIRFAIDLDDVRYPRPEQQWYWAFPEGTYKGEGAKLPAFAIPVDEAQTGSVVMPAGSNPPVRWKLPKRTVDAFEKSPEFKLQSLSVPDSVGKDEGFTASFTVRNTGEKGGQFIAEFGAGEISDYGEVSVAVSQGSETSHSIWVEPTYYPENADEVEVTLDWGCSRVDRAVTVNG